MGRDDLGDRMKRYECTQSFLPCLPIVLRIDGKSFHTYTKGLDKPFDSTFMDVMIETAIGVTQEINPVITYVQSDEITTILYSDNFESQVYFDGQVQKLVSVVASVATAHFNFGIGSYVRNKPHGGPLHAYFDCRAFQVPTLQEAVNCLIWRENDAVKNSIQALARAHYKPRELVGKKQSDLHEMLYAKGVNWNDLTPRCKRGTYIRRQKVQVRDDPVVIRDRYIEDHGFPTLSKIANPVEVIFNCEQIVMKAPL